MDLIELNILNLHLKKKKNCLHHISRQEKLCKTVKKENDVSVVPFKMFFLHFANKYSIAVGAWN